MSSKIIFSGKYLQILRAGTWEYTERINSKSSVLIFAILTSEENPEEKSVILVEQFRIPVGKNVIELSAGICEVNEHPMDAARRELEEETGYRAGTMDFLFMSPSSPGLTNEMIEVFAAKNLVKVSNGGGVDNEKIKIHIVSLAHLRSWLRNEENSRNCLVDHKIYAALGWLNI